MTGTRANTAAVSLASLPGELHQLMRQRDRYALAYATATDPSVRRRHAGNLDRLETTIDDLRLQFATDDPSVSLPARPTLSIEDDAAATPGCHVRGRLRWSEARSALTAMAVAAVLAGAAVLGAATWLQPTDAQAAATEPKR